MHIITKMANPDMTPLLRLKTLVEEGTLPLVCGHADCSFSQFETIEGEDLPTCKSMAKMAETYGIRNPTRLAFHYITTHQSSAEDAYKVFQSCKKLEGNHYTRVRYTLTAECCSVVVRNCMCSLLAPVAPQQPYVTSCCTHIMISKSGTSLWDCSCYLHTHALY